MLVNGTDVTINGLDGVTEKEIISYLNYIQNATDDEIATLTITSAPNGNVALDYTLRPQKFERIRRITGYLVGTIDRWNNAKRSEEQDRVKHDLH